MLNLIGKAITGVMLTREARDAVREVGGLASAIQSSADARLIKAAMAAHAMQVGSTPLTSPRTWTVANPVPLAVRMARAAMPGSTPAPATPPPPASAPAPMPTPFATPIPDPSDRIVPSDFGSAKGKDFLTPERAALIKNAMKLRNDKQTVLAHLTDEQRAKLTAIATKALFPQAAE
jgi:hypothetical protein